MWGFREGKLTVDYVRISVDKVKAMFNETKNLFQ
ncbi:hypothetical protein [Vulcanisaeta souniana]|uniref:Uncharacterized protein n=1 Tax=Vulcanisaeta souniana JCM 11219 TaxID=1293586 RepID=A0ABM8BJC8_9CREN|nr:hypothetical protein [Vulcanisaeta souniana]BDR91070.1 hypothetical protein Vsou_01630 [Vulcanisaeta souniana JCM 11219]